MFFTVILNCSSQPSKDDTNLPPITIATTFTTTTLTTTRRLLVHGFTVDEHGRKMSKSEGNVVDPSSVTDGDGSTAAAALGADVLR